MSHLRGSSNYGKDQEGRPITTLYLRPLLVGELKHDDILSHFSAFGAVKSVRILNQPKYSYGFVKFIRPESAAKALRIPVHVVAGRTVEIKVASDRHQDFSFLLNLNDDCILEILSMKCLTVMDLCSAAKASRRLKEIASRVFKMEHKKCDIARLSGVNTITAKRILKYFGSEISDLKVYGLWWIQEAMKYVTKYCSITLKSLDLEFFVILENVTVKLKLLFKNLQKLTLTDCSFEGTSADLFDDCGSLVELNLDIGRECSAFVLERTFPKLERFSCSSFHDSNSFHSFISRHVNLKSLKIGYVESSSLQLIAQCKRLETLKCHIFANTTLDLSNFGRLRQLEIDGHRNDMKTLLGFHNLIFLEQLTLDEFEIDSEFVRTLPQLQTLRVLKLLYCTGLANLNQIGKLGQLTTLKITSNEIFDWDIVVLIKRLGKLNSLRVAVPGFELNLETYLAIVDVVRRRRDRSKITLTFKCDEPHIYDNLLVDFARNAHLVEVNVCNYFF